MLLQNTERSCARRRPLTANNEQLAKTRTALVLVNCCFLFSEITFSHAELKAAASRNVLDNSSRTFIISSDQNWHSCSWSLSVWSWPCCSLTAAAQQMCFVQHTDGFCGHQESVSPVQAETLRSREAARSTRNNLFRLKTAVSVFRTSYAPRWGIHNEAYVVYAFRQTHNFSAFTARTGALAGAAASGWRHTALIDWVSTTLWQIHS